LRKSWYFSRSSRSWILWKTNYNP